MNLTNPETRRRSGYRSRDLEPLESRLSLSLSGFLIVLHAPIPAKISEPVETASRSSDDLRGRDPAIAGCEYVSRPGDCSVGRIHALAATTTTRSRSSTPVAPETGFGLRPESLLATHSPTNLNTAGPCPRIESSGVGNAASVANATPFAEGGLFLSLDAAPVGSMNASDFHVSAVGSVLGAGPIALDVEGPGLGQLVEDQLLRDFAIDGDLAAHPPEPAASIGPIPIDGNFLKDQAPDSVPAPAESAEPSWIERIQAFVGLNVDDGVSSPSSAAAELPAITGVLAGTAMLSPKPRLADDEAGFPRPLALGLFAASIGRVCQVLRRRNRRRNRSRRARA